MRSAEVSPGRRLVAALEPGEEVLASIGALCAEHQFRAAIVPVFFGAFTRVTLIGTHEPVEDEDAPMPQSTTVEWVEGLGAATVAPDEDGGLIVHLHAAVGRKSAGAIAYAGHVLSAVTHYTAELVVEEVLGTVIERRPDAAAHGLNTLRFWRLARFWRSLRFGLALVDPHVVCITGTRPALSWYEGHAGMAQLVTDLRAVYGRYRVDATADVDSDLASLGDSVTEVGVGTRVVVRMGGTRETEDGEVTMRSALVIATVRAGLVTFLETVPEN